MAIETTEWNTKDTLGKTLEGLEASKSQESSGLEGDKLVLNMGPSHPSTHGVLRIILELDGEVITKPCRMWATCTEAMRKSPRT